MQENDALFALLYMANTNESRMMEFDRYLDGFFISPAMLFSEFLEHKKRDMLLCL